LYICLFVRLGCTIFLLYGVGNCSQYITRDCYGRPRARGLWQRKRLGMNSSLFKRSRAFRRAWYAQDLSRSAGSVLQSERIGDGTARRVPIGLSEYEAKTWTQGLASKPDHLKGPNFTRFLLQPLHPKSCEPGPRPIFGRGPKWGGGRRTRFRWLAET
jgi:hypothetical protein